jgi:Holliday junction DNA helicase RuvA
MFRMLMATNGIGPKLALSALSGLSVREIKAAIVEGDVKRLSSISGVGRKMAERIAVECRDKIDRGEAMEALAGGEEATDQDVRTRDAVLALVSLGYKQAAARKMVAGAMRGADNLDVEDIIKRSLSGSP